MSNKLEKRKLTESIKNTGGRNNTGRITSYHRGGGKKRRYRIIDFKRELVGVPGVIKRIENDPNRTGKIALICYSNGLVTYILASEGLQVGDCVMTDITPEWEQQGVCRSGSLIRLGSLEFKEEEDKESKKKKLGEILSNIELYPGKGIQIARSAGSKVRSVKADTMRAGYVVLRLSSGELRSFSGKCLGMVGRMSNVDHYYDIIGKAGKKRWAGRRPVVRGVAMNPVDHPHGGGEGKKSGGNKTPWGHITKGQATRDKHKKSERLIVKRRKR